MSELSTIGVVEHSISNLENAVFQEEIINAGYGDALDEIDMALQHLETARRYLTAPEEE
jgi:hypothetical protein